MNWIEILGSVASGGVLGLLGNALSFGLNYFKNKQEHGFAMDRLRLEGELTAAKTAGEVAVVREAGAAAAFTASVNAEGAIKGEARWATTFRAITRPGLTWLGLLASITCGLFSVSNDATRSFDLYTGMMIAWWFGQRALDRSSITWSGGSIRGAVGSSIPK